MDVEKLKELGNQALSNDQLNEAISYYTQAIQLEPNNHVLYSNRSAAYAKANKYSQALEDAEKTVLLKSDWPKGYSRKGAALSLLGRHLEAKRTYEEGLKYDPGSELLKQGVVTEANLLKEDDNPLSALFSDPSFLAKLAANPKTRELLGDKDFLGKLKNPDGNFDPDFMSKLQSLFSTAGFGTPKGPPPDAEDEPPSASESAKPPSQPTNDNQRAALAEKDAGNVAYKARKFAEAHVHYDKAIELEPDNITFYNNKAAVYFEENLYEQCIETCNKAVEIGRENRADFKLIGKAYARMANAYAKMEKYKEALNFYDKSLSECRDPEVVKRRQEMHKKVKELEESEYFNPDLAQEEKQKGNDCFKKGQYPEAVKYYTEAIRRNPRDSALYSNRAACYTKLMEFELALVDCEKCISLDAKFLKGHLRKGAVLMAMKQYARAVSAYEEALKLDPSCEEALNGYRDSSNFCEDNPEEVRKSAMENPEVRELMNDPAMMLILEQMSKDPKAVREHLANPEIASKIQKLMEYGIVRMR